MIKKLFLAANRGDEKATHDGPYKTAEEAEAQAFKLGWGWVCVYAQAEDDSGAVLDVEKRYYEPSRWKHVQSHSPIDVEALRRNLSTPDPKPLNHEELLFFASYEIQMLPEPAPRIDAAKFKAEIKKRINGKS